jgi:hypothetical protein
LVESIFIIREGFFGLRKIFEGVLIFLQFQETNSKIGQSQGVSGIVLNRMLIKLGCLLVIAFVFVDISEVVPCIRVPGVDFNSFSV